MGFSSGGNPLDMFNGAMQGLLQGVTSIGLNYAVQELDWDPLLANVGFSVIAQFLQSSVVPSQDPNDKRTIFEKMFDTFKGNVATFLGYNPTPNINEKRFWELDLRTGEIIPGTFKQNAYNQAWGNYYWQEAVYTSQILDFSQIIQERGLVDALNTYATGFFNSVAINAIVSTGLTIGEYFADALGLTPPEQTEKIIEIKDKDGNVVSKAIFRKNANGQWELMGKEEGNFIGIGKLGVDAYGQLKYWDDAELLLHCEDYDQYQSIKEGKESFATIKDKNGNIIFVVEPRTEGGYNVYNSLGEYVDARILNNDFSYDVTLDYDDFIEHGYGFNFTEDTDFTWLENAGLSPEDLNNFKVEEKIDSTGAKSYSLEWRADTSNPIPQSWIDALKTADAKERIINAILGQEFRTKTEISQHYETNATILETGGRTGMVVNVRGMDFPSNVIKATTGGPISHTAMFYVDNAGNKWMIQMEGWQPRKGLEKVSLDVWLEDYRQSGADINIGWLSGDTQQIENDLKFSIERNLFYWEQDANGNMVVTDQIIDKPYDTLNLAGIDGPGEICSSLIVQIYEDAGHPLFGLYQGDEQNQYSPNDVYRRLKLLGYVD